MSGALVAVAQHQPTLSMFPISEGDSPADHSLLHLPHANRPSTPLPTEACRMPPPITRANRSSLPQGALSPSKPPVSATPSCPLDGRLDFSSPLPFRLITPNDISQNRVECHEPIDCIIKGHRSASAQQKCRGHVVSAEDQL